MSTVYRRSPAIEMAPLQEETILFDPQNNKFCLLNRTAAFIWNQLATPAASETVGAGRDEVAFDVVPFHKHWKST